jgi:hypothetical protein
MIYHRTEVLDTYEILLNSNMSSNTKTERDEKTSTIEGNPRSTATELDKVRNFESEKRNKLITAQDELDAIQEQLDKNNLEETRTTTVKKAEEPLLNMVKIHGGSLDRAAAAWRLAHEILKETEARLRAGLVPNPAVTGDRPTSTATPKPHFMALSFLRCPETRDKSITDSRLFFHQSMNRLELQVVLVYDGEHE